MTQIQQMRQWQAEAAAVLAAGNLSPSEEFGCKLGIQDAIKEEILLMLEDYPPPCTCNRIGPDEWDGQDCDLHHSASEYNRKRRAAR